MPLVTILPKARIRVAARGTPPTARMEWALVGGDVAAEFGKPKVPKGVKVKLGSAKLARAKLAPGKRMRITVEGVPVGGARYRWPVEIPVLKPVGHPPIKLLLFGPVHGRR